MTHVRRLRNCLLLIALAGCLAGCATHRAGDGALASEVRTRLATHEELLAPNDVRVQVLGGVVYLSGLVATDLQRDTAEDIARATRGAPRVIDMIGIEYGGR